MRWSTLVVTAMMLVSAAGAAYADDSESAPEQRIANAAMMFTYSTTFFVQMYEIRTTIRAVDAGARELNPLLSPVASQSGTLIAIGLARATTINLALRSMAKRNKWAAVVMGAGINSAYLVVATHNNRVADEARARQAAR
jgi:hypothetical protein